MTQTERAFIGIVKEGLFPIHSEEFMVNESILDNVDWNEVYRLAGEQNVIGLVSAGLDRFRVRGSAGGGVAVHRADVADRATQQSNEWLCCGTDREVTGRRCICRTDERSGNCPML